MTAVRMQSPASEVRPVNLPRGMCTAPRVTLHLIGVFLKLCGAQLDHVTGGRYARACEQNRIGPLWVHIPRYNQAQGLTAVHKR
jgi:hypothetical protein